MNPDDEIFPVDENDTDVMVTLELDDGEELDCEILLIFEVKELDKSFIALQPVDTNGTEYEEGEVILYRYHEEEDGSPVIDNIEDEDEYNLASEILEQIVAGELEDAEDIEEIEVE